MSEARKDPLGVKLLGGIRLATHVRVQGIRPELLLGLMVVSDLCNAYETVVVVTAILNGKHMVNSLHYTGAAVDFVTALDVDRTEWLAELRDRLGLLFDVIDETDHIHIEYQPHVGPVT